VDSEVGRLRAVIVHRPGAELKRVLLGTSEFLLRPLSDLVFLRDPSVWIGD